MKSMILVLKPEEAVKLLNDDLSILVRKKFSKDYVGWVYIYCTKLVPYGYGCMYDELSKKYETTFCDSGKELPNLTGKVVARFWCDKVEEINHYNSTDINDDCSPIRYTYFTSRLAQCDLLNKSGLDNKKLYNYIGIKNGYAIHITKLEIFDKPKELREFKKPWYCNCKLRCNNNLKHSFCRDVCSHNLDSERLDVCCDRDGYVKEYNTGNRYLNKAPTNYCWIEE